MTAYLGAGEQALAVLTDDERETLAELLRKLLVGLEGPAKKSGNDGGSEAKAARVKDPKRRSRFEQE